VRSLGLALAPAAAMVFVSASSFGVRLDFISALTLALVTA